MDRRLLFALPLLASCTAEQLRNPRETVADYIRSRDGTPLADGAYRYDLDGGWVRATQRGFRTIVEVAPRTGGYDRAIADGIFLEGTLTPDSRALLRATGNARLMEIAGLRSRRPEGEN